MQQPQLDQPQEHTPDHTVITETKRKEVKQPFTPPKLTFVAPKLTKQGTVKDLTAGLLGTFSP